MMVHRAENNDVKPDAELAHWHRVVERLPLTVQPSFNEQLSRWALLFPFEQKQVETFLRGADSLTPAELLRVTANLRAIEARMGVDQWNLSRTVNSMENSAQLARSQHYSEWRAAVNALLTDIEARIPAPSASQPPPTSVIVCVLPDCLPFGPATAWDPWQAEGRPVVLQGDPRQFFQLLITNSILDPKSDSSIADSWLIDAGTTNAAGSINLVENSPIACLNYQRLRPLREKFLAGLNTVPRDTHTASENINILRSENWSAYWPPEFAAQDRLQNFVVELFLSGNGSLIFSNAFVQWASSEALRRARPRVLIARFGMRTRPKPFTGIAIFENQSKVSTLPEVDDPENSAIDAAILARYVWLSAVRHPEYKRALCICVAEHARSAWIIAPPGSNLNPGPDSLSPESLHRELKNWLAS